MPVGLVHSGQIQVGMVVNFAPSTATAEVKSIEINHKSVSSALAGDFIGFNVRDVPVEHIRRGYVASDPKNDPAKDTSVFQAQVKILNHPGQISNGYTPVIDCHTCHVACRLSNLL